MILPKGTDKKPAVTFLVDRLERAGLVSRQAKLTEVPELDDYHAAVRRTASELSATGSAAVAGFLSAVTAEAEVATKRLAGRK